MTIQQGVDSLLAEVEAVLGTGNLAPQRQLYFEGARDYLVTLKRITSSGGETKKPAKPKAAAQAAEQRSAAERNPKASPTS